MARGVQDRTKNVLFEPSSFPSGRLLLKPCFCRAGSPRFEWNEMRQRKMNGGISNRSLHQRFYFCAAGVGVVCGLMDENWKEDT